MLAKAEPQCFMGMGISKGTHAFRQGVCVREREREKERERERERVSE